jgi:hypothetical protein
MSRNEITPGAAADELAAIYRQVEEFSQALQQATSSLEFFSISAEELDPGEFEIGFLIPREAVDAELEKLGEEFIELKEIMLPISELADEGRPAVKVRSIASSGFEVFLLAPAAVAWMFIKVVDQLLATYQRLLDIRQKHRELAEDDGVPDEYLKELGDYADKYMDEKIEEIVEKTISEAKLQDKGRLNELETELDRKLKALADRIDRGYNVEVRTGELPPPPDPEDPEAEPEVELDPEVREAAEGVLELQKSIDYMNVSGKPILHLEQARDDEGDADASQDDPGEEKA